MTSKMFVVEPYDFGNRTVGAGSYVPVTRARFVLFSVWQGLFVLRNSLFQLVLLTVLF